MPNKRARSSLFNPKFQFTPTVKRGVTTYYHPENVNITHTVLWVVPGVDPPLSRDSEPFVLEANDAQHTTVCDIDPTENKPLNVIYNTTIFLMKLFTSKVKKNNFPRNCQSAGNKLTCFRKLCRSRSDCTERAV